MILKFACLCGCQDEGEGDPPLCWGCGEKMRAWGVRDGSIKSTVLNAEQADKRTTNGGY